MQGNRPERSSVATFYGFSAVILWSVTVAFVRSISEQLGPLTGAAAVYSLSGIFGIGILYFKGGLFAIFKKSEIRYLAVCGTLFVAYMLFFFLAIGGADNRVQVLEAGLLNYLWPVLTLAGTVVFNRKKARWFLVPSIIIAVAGTFITLTSTVGDRLEFKINENLTIYLFALAGAVSWAAYSILAGKLARNSEVNPVPLFLIVTGVVIFILSLNSAETSQWNGNVFGEIAVLAIATLAGYELWDRSMRRGNITAVAAFSYLTPLFSTVFSVIYLSVIPSVNLFTGCALLIAGSILSWKAVD